MVTWNRSTVRNDDVELAVFHLDAPDAADERPTVVLVHGWPDSHHLWDHVAPALGEHFRVISYDTRGYGESTRPDEVSAYRLEHLASDLFDVIDEVSPGEPVHVIGHDWGSVQLWEAVTTPGAQDKIKSFTSVSGPNLDYLGEWAQGNLTNPTPGNLGRALSQLASSAYTAFFQVPVLPQAFFNAFGSEKIWTEFLHAVEGTPRENVSFAPTLKEDMISGLRFYSANIREKLAKPDPRPTTIPVLELVNERDIALRPAIYSRSHEHANKLWRKNSDTGHWLPYTNPDYLSESAREFIQMIEDGTSSSPNTIDRARRLGPAQKLGGKLAVITGAGSGIGRETAYALAELGCEVVLADINAASAEETAIECKAKGVLATVYELDVSSTEAVNEFAERVRRTHGVADIVVNNAGIALAGSALAASEEQVDRILAINLRGVIAGSRAFGRQMVERGTGGHIVNLSSASAFTPQRDMALYSATKAGVLMFCESLRAELADYKIGVTAICPGIVHTNITSTTEIVGLEDADGNRKRIDDFYARRGFTPDKVAKDIVKAILANKAVVPVTPEAKFGYLSYRLFPWGSRLAARVKLAK
ncbi:putative oxidoreductase [Gordonia hirsuta DSM 44140 = NBRC 16056]|uniref:Putative oxidoreductase n=1 Tax=Gordonia hirsuta DSM 44140 = NBRC 16056 TaxID=1121927 RepID=L7LDZ0_9ACTN|nr:SDR family oxidoreductase [Gordonia hirsuta]GAC58268.1 putative oxidoreductase [Gordonia hirsuta DSM 44140 = NBRC 16056]